jgi:hypothetical protein
MTKPDFPGTKPDFSKMTGQELLEAYNGMSTAKRKAKFQNKEEGVQRCEEAWVRYSKEEAAAHVAKAKEAKPAQGRIKLLVKDNPRREGTDAHAHFEAMRLHPRVEDYLSSFEDRRTAQRWLYNTRRDGYVEVV